MSGVYFRGMKMPEACNGCPAHHFYFPPVKFADDEVLTTAVPVCMAVGKELPTLSQENQKPDWCPAISVPDHGRLIDAEALGNKCISEPSFVAEMLFRKIQNAPPIIPADKEETE